MIQTCAKTLAAAFGSDVARCSGYRRALIEASIVTNAALAAYSVQQELGADKSGQLRVVYGVYLLETREVWVPRLGDRKTVGLAAAPHNLDEFHDLGKPLSSPSELPIF